MWFVHFKWFHFIYVYVYFHCMQFTILISCLLHLHLTVTEQKLITPLVLRLMLFIVMQTNPFKGIPHTRTHTHTHTYTNTIINWIQNQKEREKAFRAQFINFTFSPLVFMCIKMKEEVWVEISRCLGKTRVPFIRCHLGGLMFFPTRRVMRNLIGIHTLCVVPTRGGASVCE